MGANQTIGKNVIIKENVILGDNINIGDNVYIDANCIIRDNVTIGNNSTIGANCILGECQMDFYTNGRKSAYHPLTIGEMCIRDRYIHQKLNIIMFMLCYSK